MYSRSYPDMNPDMLIPDGYGGTALGGKSEEYIESSENKDADTSEAMAVPRGKSLLSIGGLGNLFTGLIPSLKEGKLFNSFGSEELLIIGAALLLFFSKEGDKECAILLFLLLFLG